LATPAQRHRGENKEVLASRHVLYQQARNQHPYRCSGSTRYWQPIGAGTLNLESELTVLKKLHENTVDATTALQNAGRTN